MLKVSIRKTDIRKLKKVAPVVKIQEMLATDFITATIDTTMSKEEFWSQWNK